MIITDEIKRVPEQKWLVAVKLLRNRAMKMQVKHTPFDEMCRTLDTVGWFRNGETINGAKQRWMSTLPECANISVGLNETMKIAFDHCKSCLVCFKSDEVPFTV
jgi:hypothetical protein